MNYDKITRKLLKEDNNACLGARQQNKCDYLLMRRDNDGPLADDNLTTLYALFSPSDNECDDIK